MKHRPPFGRLSPREQAIAATAFEWALRAMRDTHDKYPYPANDEIYTSITSDEAWQERLTQILEKGQ